MGGNCSLTQNGNNLTWEWELLTITGALNGRSFVLNGYDSYSKKYVKVTGYVSDEDSIDGTYENYDDQGTLLQSYDLEMQRW
jgi:hypothetical protein